MSGPYDLATLLAVIKEMDPEQTKPVNKGEALQKWIAKGASDKAQRNKALATFCEEGNILADNLKMQDGSIPVMMKSAEDSDREEQFKRYQEHMKTLKKEEQQNAGSSDSKAQQKKGPATTPEQEKQIAAVTKLIEEKKDLFCWISGQKLMVQRLIAKEQGFTKHPLGFYFRFFAKGGDAGKSPLKDDECSCHYEGKLLTGQIFDSSFKRGEPTNFAPSGVITAWKAALQILREGDDVELVCPPDVAYGAQGARGVIPPNSYLIFRLQLLKVLKGGKTGAQASEQLKLMTKKKYEDFPIIKLKEDPAAKAE